MTTTAAAAGSWTLGDRAVNHIDTAAFYFSPSRSANELINSALAPYPDDLVITTKVWPGRTSWPRHGRSRRWSACRTATG